MTTAFQQSHGSGADTIETSLTGTNLLKNSFLNKDTAFLADERKAFMLDGLLPPHIESIEDQVQRCYEAFSRKTDALEQHIYLRSLQDRNETLFYKLIIDHLTEMMPIIYTPTVGEACLHFSKIYRQPRGLFISYPQKNRIAEILNNAPIKDVKVIVVTDGERILGLGDQGAGGMGIPIGKLSLYTACGGINPANTLPIVLDVGTNNLELRTHPSYIGWRHERITGDEYFDFVEQFIVAIKNKYPNVLLQFEDFAQQNANLLLQKYRQQLCMFNDDIQGTAAVAVAALIAAVNATETELKDQRVVVFGAGSAGCGISEQLIRVLVQQGLSEAAARSLFFMVDRQGLLHDGMTGLLEFQKNLLQPYAKVKTWAAKDKEIISLLDVIQQAKPTILLGVSGIPNQFTKEIIEAMQANCQRPIIFPMSNPTSRSEANPADLIHWTNGQALIATGSPFPDVVYNKKTYAIAQCNNCYIFPGMGLGVMISAAKRITDAMFMQATMTLSEQAAALSTKGSALLPSLENIRQVSDKIAYAVAKQAMREGVAETISDDELKEAINKNKWVPGYQPMRLSNVNGNAG